MGVGLLKIGLQVMKFPGDGVGFSQDSGAQASSPWAADPASAMDLFGGGFESAFGVVCSKVQLGS